MKAFYQSLGILFLVFILIPSVLARTPLSLEFVDLSSSSVQANGESFLGHISHDGRYVAFYSRANNLSPADTNTFVDLYLRDLSSNTTSHVAPILINSTAVALHRPEISADNTWIVFESFASLVAADTNTTQDTYLYNIDTGAFELVSSGTGSSDSGNPSISYSGCYVVYDVGLNGVYLYDRSLNTTSLLAAGALDPHISADGNYVVYARLSDRSLFLYDRSTSTTTFIDSTSFSPVISADGSLIVYSHQDTWRVAKTYDTSTNTYTILSNTVTGGDSGDVSVTADGSWVVFGSFADDLVAAPDSNSMDIFAYEMATNTIERLSYRTDSSEPNNRTDIPIISGNGLSLIFQTFASDYISPDNNGSTSDVILADYDLVTSAISTPTDGNCAPAVPVYDSVVPPASTITITGAAGTVQSATLDISNIGDAASLLDVIQVGTLTDFTISTLPTGLTPAASPVTVTITCTIPSSGTLSETLTLQSNEAGSPQYTYTLQCLPTTSPELSISGITVNESAGLAQFTISLNIALGTDLTLDIASSDVSATGGSDYTAVPPATQLTILAGSTSITYDVPIIDDTDVESTETFTLTISNPSIGTVTITTASATGTILDNDNPAVSSPGTSLTGGITVFDPAISKIGLLMPGDLGVTGETIEWIVTVSNPSAVTGTNVVISDTLDAALQIEDVIAPGASVNISGQTVTVTYAALSPNTSVQFSIITKVLAGVTIFNTACVNAANQAAQECATGSLVSQLPSTGETPIWRYYLLGLFLLPLIIIGRKIQAKRYS